MAGSGACCPPHRRLPTVANAGADPDVACADPGSGQSSLPTAHAHADSHAHAETHKYTLPAANGHADPGSFDGNANPHPNAVSAPTNTHRHVDPDPAHRDTGPHDDTQATRPHTHECPSFSTIPSGPVRSLASLPQLSEGASLHRRPRHRRLGLPSGRRAAGLL